MNFSKKQSLIRETKYAMDFKVYYYLRVRIKNEIYKIILVLINYIYFNILIKLTIE